MYTNKNSRLGRLKSNLKSFSALRWKQRQDNVTKFIIYPQDRLKYTPVADKEFEILSVHYSRPSFLELSTTVDQLHCQDVAYHNTRLACSRILHSDC